MTRKKVRTAVLISGRGSNMVALAEASMEQKYPAEICLVLSNIPDALGLQKATDMGIPVAPMDHTDFQNRESFEDAMHNILSQNGIELICCAGFMRILSPSFVRKWPDRILNIHPSLLPKYKGLNTHKRALEAGDSVHGCTVHYVNEELDGGEIVLQEAVNIVSGETVNSLEKKVLKIEHPLYVRALKKVANSIISVR